VLDLGIWRPAPFATQLLAEMGAAVTKVEPPGGDPMRVFPALYATLNGRKQVIEVDLKTTAGRESVRELAAVVDVAVEGFRPGVAERLGVGYDDLRDRNPALVYCSISGYGQNGPLASAAGHDLNYQAWSGVLAARGPDLAHAGIPVADLAGGAYASMAICAALVGRGRTGVGEHVDVSMSDVLLSWAGPEIGGELASGDDPGSRFPGYGTFACADGPITIGIVSEDHFWVALCGVVGLDDLAGRTATERAADGVAIERRLRDRIAGWTRDDLLAALDVAGVPAAPVLTAAEAARSPHFLARGTSRLRPDGTVELHHPVHFGGR
jgi:crotonobetainyl-CoA:carnitine CoA-transferase CaiB-like acyl-CoA transferase